MYLLIQISGGWELREFPGFSVHCLERGDPVGHAGKGARPLGVLLEEEGMHHPNQVEPQVCLPALAPTWSLVRAEQALSVELHLGH